MAARQGCVCHCQKMCKPKNLGLLALIKRSGRLSLKACDAQNLGHNRPPVVGFPIRDILQTFKRVRDKAMQKEDTRGELQALLARSLHSPDATYRRYAAQVRQESCQLMSELHKLSSPAQRQHLINTLKSYEIDS